MAAGYCRLDGPGQNSATNCFPARTLLGRRKDAGGHWLVSYREAVEQRDRRKKQRGRDRQAHTAPRGRTLDRDLMLLLNCVDDPSELSSVNVSEQQLCSVKPEELRAFANVVHLDASVNFLSLGSLRCLVSLREVNLSVNGLRSMAFDAADFPHLQVLDLSYNSLTTSDITAIGRLPRLKVLHLTGNQLRRLPPDLACSGDATQLSVEGGFPPFGCLEVLNLDDNKLSSGVFNSLRNLRRLTHLNLRRNHVREIPYLPEILNLTGVQEEEKKKTALSADVSDAVKHVSDPSRWIKHQQTLRDDDRESTFPLPQLQLLDLSENRITEEEALLSAALFPRLCELDIHSNPLTTRRSGDPPLLTYCLQHRLGVRVKRRESRETKTRMKISTNPRWKLNETIPPVSKKSLFEEKPEIKRGKSPESGIVRRKEETENFFVTQAENFSEDEVELHGGEDENAQNHEENVYEMLGTRPEVEEVQPIGIQTAVRMLEHTLKNLNVYRESKPRVDIVQMPQREKVKKIKRLPPLQPRKRPRERVDELLHQIRGCSSVRSAPCNVVVNGIGDEDRNERKEVMLLLKDMKTRYQAVHRKTLTRAPGAGTAPSTSSV